MQKKKVKMLENDDYENLDYDADMVNAELDGIDFNELLDEMADYDKY